MQFHILTLFPQLLECYFSESILKRAIQNKKISCQLHNFRDNAVDKHNTVDDKPYGGGAGMLLMVEPIVKTLAKIKRKKNSRVILLTPGGKIFNQQHAKRLAKCDQVILIAGRYEGFDKRVEKFVDEKISIGQYVLAGGEIAAMAITEAIARNIPGVLGHENALDEESYSKTLDYIEYPHYTRPENFKHKGTEYKVPKVLLSGDHKKIAQWREKKAKNNS